MVNNWLADRLAPCYCELCQLPSGRALGLCWPCQAELPANSHGCHRCGIPLAARDAPPSSTPAAGAAEPRDGVPPAGSVAICGNCQQHPPAYQHSCAPWLYTPPLDGFLRRFKFSADLPMLPLLTELLVAAVERELHRFGVPDLLVPVPLHWRRRWRRGFNQSELLARSLSRHLRLRHWQLQVAPRLCRKIRATPAQQQLDRRRRQRNLRQAFTCRDDVDGKFLVLVDDVMTTGATVHHLAQVLHGAGAARVHVWCVARTPQPCNPPDLAPY